MQRCLLVALLAAGMLCPNLGYAEESQPIARGTAGLAALTFDAHNVGMSPIACSAALAHWYSVDFGTAGPGENVRAILWQDPANGATYVINAKQDRMPIQALWCGLVGHAWATRTALALPRRGEAPRIELRCAEEGERLACR